MSGFVPYCGVPPVPGSETWNLDPWLIGGLLIGGAALASRAHHSRMPNGERCCLAAGWLVFALSFLSPLCNLSVALFSARVTQHMALTLVAAPVVVRGFVGLTRSPARPVSIGSALAATAVFAAVFWLWHSPAAYDETLRNNFVYWLMHLTTIGAAFALWTAVFRRPASSPF
jgi:putative membrane protein